MSLYRDVRKTLEKRRKGNPEAQLIYELLENATVLVDVSDLDLITIYPADGEEAIIPPFGSAWIENHESAGTSGVLVRAMSRDETIHFIGGIDKTATQQQFYRNLFGTETYPTARYFAGLDVSGALHVLPFFKSLKPGWSTPFSPGSGLILPFDSLGRDHLTLCDPNFPPTPKVDQELVWRYSLRASAIVIVTYSMLNCRNIELADKDPSSRPTKKRKGKTGLTWKVLAIKPKTSRRRSDSSQESSERLTRAHLVRGHFKTFTPDKPLLGRATGRFWWSPQVRGNAERGAVIKDYSLRNS